MTEYELVKISKVTGVCGLCEEYAEKNSTSPAKVAVMSCEGACARGEVARRAANILAQIIAPEQTVRICLGGAFTKDTGQRNLVRRAGKVIAIEGCFIACASRMMEGVLDDLNPTVVLADTIYPESLPFGMNEVSDELFTTYAKQVAEDVQKNHLRA
ncbi:putative zinc-binding protein [Methanospirillum purgamenti]|jgi:uncharacterized metal-binding protein|uniref:Zinc-binding protein n=1 Tax=Methanospirillum hungatei TaxID=2203 RepID=A0A8F5ZEU1_METHU|nr:putative zinc-binding protein [Methanospirillum hungatei]QXO95142.1 putative zinc-binding protein [Methanospirillum hungatei]